MVKEILNKGSKFFRIYSDKEDYFLRNIHGNILVVSKVILLERFGYRFLRKKDTATEDNIGVWKKILTADEGFEMVEKKDWETMEAERIKGNGPAPVPTEKKVEMGPDESKVIARAEAEAKVKAGKIIQDAKDKAKVEAEAITQKATDDAQAKADAEAKKAEDEAKKGNQ